MQYTFFYFSDFELPDQGEDINEDQDDISTFKDFAEENLKSKQLMVIDKKENIEKLYLSKYFTNHNDSTSKCSICTKKFHQDDILNHLKVEHCIEYKSFEKLKNSKKINVEKKPRKHKHRNRVFYSNILQMTIDF